MRYLGIFPPEGDILDIMDSVSGQLRSSGATVPCPLVPGKLSARFDGPQMHEEEPTKYVTFERFEVRALEMLREGKYAPDSEEMLLAAFKVRHAT